MPPKKPLNTQSLDKLLNLSTTPNPLYEGQMLSTGALEEINKLKQPSISPMPISSSVPSAMPNQNVIRNAGIQMMPEEQMLKETSDDSSNFLGSLIAQGIAGIGTGLMGGDSYAIQRSASIFQGMRDKQENERKAKLYTDPKSEESKKRRLVFEKALGFKIPEEYSYTDLNDPVVLQSIRDKNMQAIAPRGGIGGARGGGVTQVKPEKERKLSQDERALLNNSALAYKALFDMEDAIKRDVSKTSYFGDNDYTYAANRFVEGIGRMQSGGAIGPDEVENFKKLIPGRYDSPELSKKKINDMKAELESRLKSINYDPNEVLKSRSFTELDITPKEEDEAIQWANKNINSKDEATRIKAERILRGQ
jgi:hypothetical protein